MGSDYIRRQIQASTLLDSNRGEAINWRILQHLLLVCFGIHGSKSTIFRQNFKRVYELLINTHLLRSGREDMTSVNIVSPCLE